MQKRRLVRSLVGLCLLCAPTAGRIIAGGAGGGTGNTFHELSDINRELAAREHRIISSLGNIDQPNDALPDDSSRRRSDEPSDTPPKRNDEPSNSPPKGNDELYDSPPDRNRLNNLPLDSSNIFLRVIWDNLIAVKDEIEKVSGQTRDILHRMHVVDCSFLSSESPSGVYKIHVGQSTGHPTECFCDMETRGGGWTVILNRVAHLTADASLNFTRPMREYKIGFGSARGDFWIGLETIHRLSKLRNYELLIELGDFEGKRASARYESFYIEGEDNGYRLHVSGYSGDAGDSLTNWGKPDDFTADGMQFSTVDLDRDLSPDFNCAKDWDIGGWWYNRCSWANLMGPYRLPGTGSGIGLNWHKWQNKQYMRTARMLIRPRQD